jgi:hypothetical protein
MAKWKKNESLGHALAREGRGVAKGVMKEFLSVATFGLYSPKKYCRRESRRGRKS